MVQLEIPYRLLVLTYSWWSDNSKKDDDDDNSPYVNNVNSGNPSYQKFRGKSGHDLK